MDWQWWHTILSLLASVRAFDCPEGVGCSSCQRYPEDIYEMDCATSNDDIIKVEIRSNDYVKMTCHNYANWSEFHLGSLHPIAGIGSLSFSMCNLPDERGLESIAKQLLVDKVEVLTFCSYMNLSSTLTNDTLRGFGSVKKLTLSSNNFTDLPRDLLQDLGNLTLINLRDNNLHSVPKNFFRSKNIETIEISTNELGTLDSSTFGKLERLRLLNLWDNELVKIMPNTFDELASLETLGLQRNNLETLPNGIFDRLDKLKIINLSQNNFTSNLLPDDLLRNCKNLQSVVLMENKRNMTTLPDGFFANMTKLTSVKLRKIGLLSLPENLFRGTINLQNVSLERNYLTTLGKDIFKDASQLSTLDLNFNDLSYLPDDVFKNLRNLVKLDLSRNNLSVINENLFSGLTSLRELSIERNNLINIDFHAFDSLQKLRVARFSYNNLNLKSSWGTLGSPFRSSEDLEELYLDHNNVSDIFEDWMYSMRAIRVLSLSHNNFVHLRDQDLQFLSQDLNVDLTHNGIRHINLDTVEIWALDRSYSRNVVISVDDNPIQCDCRLYNLLRYLEGRLHPNVQNAFHLKIGKLKCNGPVELRDILITELKSKTLKCDVGATGLESKCPSQCNCQVRPENKAFIVDCANLGLTEAPSTIEGPLGYAVELNLSRNSLTAMPSFDQPGYDKITVLALDHNNISRLSVETLSPTLKVLRLNNNGLSRVDKSVIDYLNNTSQLSELTLRSNPWFCDCEARRFLRFIQEKGRKMPDLLKVLCPGHKLPVFQMTPEELCPSGVNWIIGGCFGVAFFGIVVGVLAAMFYRHQREIKVWLFAKNWCLWFVTEDELDKDKLYDAFISYSHKDEDFVVNDLIPNLEAGPRPFKLCVHFRDWFAGEWIPKQIARSVEESRRTIVVLSPNFLESVWGRMEFRAAHSQALTEGRARVIVILYGEIGPTDDLDPELKAYLSMNTYVKWGDPWFWRKLKYAMPHPPELRDRNLRKNIFETTQPSIKMPNDKSELISPPEAPSTPPIASTPPADSAKIFIVNDVTNNECDKTSIGETNNSRNDKLPTIVKNYNNKLSNGNVNNLQCTTV